VGHRPDSPTQFTLAEDSAPDVNGRQKAVSAKAGTGLDNVRVNTISDPFTVTFSKPRNPRSLGNANPISGKYGAVPKNTYTLLIRKGVNVASTMGAQLMTVRCSIDVPAGADAYDAVNVRAALSLLVGILTEESADMGDSVVSGIL
jgi:hypothetical protein